MTHPSPALIAEVANTKAHVEADASYTEYCTFAPSDSPHKVFFVEAPMAMVEGHIYSRAGLAEYRISGSCENCFDKAFPDDDGDHL